MPDDTVVYRATILPSSFPSETIRQGNRTIRRMVVSPRDHPSYAIRVDRSTGGISATYKNLTGQRRNDPGVMGTARRSRISQEQLAELSELVTAVWSSGGTVPLERGIIAVLSVDDPVRVFEGVQNGRYRAVQTSRFYADENLRRLMDYLHEITGLNAEARAIADLATEKSYKEQLSKWEQDAGPEHSSVAHYLNELAEFYRTRGRYAEAEPLYERAVMIWENYFGPENPYLATGLENYAKLLEETDRAGLAGEMEQRARSIRAKLAAGNTGN